MAAAKKREPAGGNTANAKRSDSDSARWIAGLLIFIFGLYITASAIFYFFTWKDDASTFAQIAAGNPNAGSVANPCGPLGARMAAWLIGRGFGVFGIILPIILVMTGVRIIRRRKLHRSVLAMLLILILGSLTLGTAFGETWSIFGSGWGGECGIVMARKSVLYIGTFGTVIMLVAGWILTGVFINRNFIDSVNDAGNTVVDRSERVWYKLKSRAAASKRVVAEPVEMPAPEPEPEVAVADASAAEDEEENIYLEPSDPPYDNPAPEPEIDPLPSDKPHGDVAEMRQPAAEPAEAEEENEEPHYHAPMTINDWYSSVVPESMRAYPEQTQELSGSSEFVPADGLSESAQGVTEFVAEEPSEYVPQQSDAEPEEEVVWQDTGDSEPKDYDESEQSGGVVVNVYENKVRMLDESQISDEVYDPTKDLMNYRKPTIDMLEDYQSSSKVTNEEIYENKSRIEETLKNFGIPIQRIDATVGPTVTLYEIVQAQGVKIAKIQGLQNDIAQSLKAESGIRIIAPIPGRGTVGIEVPNRNKQVVSMYSAVRSPEFENSNAELPVVIGRTIQNKNFVFDLAKMPHLLVAGATGQGKSVGLNAIITSLLYKKHPSQLKFVMIDPKMVEFSLYSRVERHFLAKMASEDESIVTDPRKAVYTLNALCSEMDKRLELCKDAAVRNIKEYNEKFIARRLNPLKGHRYMPYIVVIIDEFADLIMTAKEVEGPVTRLAQKARAIGIHLIIATQRPSVDVITGKIKANFPARIAFRVMQMNDSRTIIDRPGAEQLIGRGDMLLSKDGELTRIQCALVDTPEVERIVDSIAAQQGYPEAYNLPDYVPESGGSGDSDGGFGSESSAPMKYDSLFAEIAREAVTSGMISVSSIQRNYEVGFNRAGRIMLQLERSGIVGRQEGAKPRPILIHDTLDLEARLQELGLS